MWHTHKCTRRKSESFKLAMTFETHSSRLIEKNINKTYKISKQIIYSLWLVLFSATKDAQFLNTKSLDILAYSFLMLSLRVLLLEWNVLLVACSKMSPLVVWWVQVQVSFVKLLHLLGPQIFTFRVVGLEPWQKTVSHDFWISITNHKPFLSKFVKEWGLCFHIFWRPWHPRLQPKLHVCPKQEPMILDT